MRSCARAVGAGVLLLSGLGHSQDFRASKNDHAEQIAAFMSTLHDRGQFDGAVLVGGSGGVIYKGAFGLAVRPKKIPFETNTESCLASVSKPFTAFAVMTLVHAGLMHLDDPISKYVFGLQSALGAVTIRELLSHTSGVPDYGNLDIEHPGLSNTEVLQALRSVDHLQFPAGEKYEYSNSGYVLLGAAVEKVTTEPLPEYLQVKVFGPLGMKNTFVLTSKALKTRAVAKGYNGFWDLDDYNEFVTGDGGMYSTVEDLYLFDRALYDPVFAPSAELDQMFTPASVRVGTTTYGLGWNIEELPSGKRVWHTGNTGGFRAYFERRITEHGVIIMLTNVGNSRRVEISAAIEHLLKGEPFSYPKRSSAVALYEIFQKSGIDATLAAYRTYKSKPSEYDVSEGELNTRGYQILYPNKKPLDAIRIFVLNTQEHPESSNAFDSLAEAYKVSGETKTAKQDYERALQLDFTNVHARTALAQLK